MRKTHTDSYLDYIIRNKIIADSMFKDSHRLNCFKAFWKFIP